MLYSHIASAVNTVRLGHHRMWPDVSDVRYNDRFQSHGGAIVAISTQCLPGECKTQVQHHF